LNNLICNKEQRIPDIGHFSGAPDPVSTSQRILYHNQEYHPPFWGHAVFLNLTKHVIIPDYVGYQNTIVDSLYPPNTTPFRIVREEGGLAGYAHGAGPNFATDLALENVDFVEVNSLDAMEPLYRAWNCGYRVVASAGEDAFPNFYRSYIIGSNRVYVAPFFFFRSKLVILRRSNSLFDQQWRASGVCLAFGHSWCDYGAKKSHRQAAEPQSQRGAQTGRDWPDNN
jgi:hypothetical protein